MVQKISDDIRADTQAFFAPVRWSAMQLEREVRAVMADVASAYRRVARIVPKDATFTNTILVLEKADVLAKNIIAITELLANVHPHKDVRETAHKMNVWARQRLMHIIRNPRVYAAITVASRRREKLRPDERKLLQDTLRAYRRMGLDLPERKQKELMQLQQTLTKKSAQFAQNINAHHDEVLLTEEEAAGLPADFVARLPRRSGTIVVSLDYPESGPFMEYITNRAKREEMWHKLMNKGGAKNEKLLREILALRRHRARLLGYATHADYVLDERMVHNAQRAEAFVQKVLHLAHARTQKDMEALRAHAQALELRALKPWDIAFVSRDLREKTHAIDTHALRAYFPLEHVLAEMMAIVGRFLDIRFERVEGVRTWHNDVRVYRIINPDDTTRAYIAMDLFPRKNKYGHAAAFDLTTGWQDGEIYHTPAAVLVTNFPKPHINQPSLLSHDEVIVLFHEFGHILHHTLSRVPLPSQSGSNVAWDFVETPSQTMEYWAWDPKVLRRLGKHYQTGKLLSPTMVRNLIATRDFQKGYATTRQMIFALFDLVIHTRPIRNFSALYNRLVYRYTGVRVPSGHRFAAGFGHLMGYDAGYYGYMWTRVFAADIVAHIRAHGGLLSPSIGRRYRSAILERGSMIDERQLLKDFLGRAPNMRAFREELKK